MAICVYCGKVQGAVVKERILDNVKETYYKCGRCERIIILTSKPVRKAEVEKV